MKYWIFIGAILMAVAVFLGAMGSHFFKDVLEHTQGKDAFFRAQFYMIIHSFGIILSGVLPSIKKGIRSNLPPAFFLTGILFFSGTLFLNSLDLLNFGMLAPLGGLSFMLGWVLFGINSLNRS